MKKVFPILFSIFLSLQLIGQENAINQYTTIKYDNSIAVGIQLHTNGWGGNFQYLVNKNVSNNFILNLDILSLKHPKEIKVLNPVLENAKPYVYGRKYHILLIRPGFGYQYIIADKENPFGIKAKANFVIGGDLALLNPIYLEFIYKNDDGKFYKETEKYDPSNPHHYNQGNIYGGTTYFKGFEDLTAAFGLFAKFSLSFEWNEYEENYKSLEAGFMIDAFPDKLPILAYIENQNIYYNLYLNLSVGKRW